MGLGARDLRLLAVHRCRHGLTGDGVGGLETIVSDQGFLSLHSLGVQLGIKWPTGRYGGDNAVTSAVVGRGPVAFCGGPGAGQMLDNSLQPGTGSTDVIVGAHSYKAASQDSEAVANGRYPAAIAGTLDPPDVDNRPGDLAGPRINAGPAMTLLASRLQRPTARTADAGERSSCQRQAAAVIVR
ncbi:MAG: hypothetical protein M0T84_09470 [Betaproteobacteria bacterium]|nr:hypothetical protein [Betaproteobacteria bacterium]